MTTPAIALTTQQIIDRVGRTFGDTAEVQVLNTDIIAWINAAIRELIKMNRLGRTKAATAAVANQEDYVLPVGITGLLEVKYLGQSLEYLSIAQADDLFPNRDDATQFPNGTPQYYWVYNNTLTLYPAPDKANATAILLYYTVYPAPVVNPGDIPGVPVEYHNRIVDYCLAQAYELNSDLNAAQIKMAQFKEDRRELDGQTQAETQTGPYPYITDYDDTYSASTFT